MILNRQVELVQDILEELHLDKVWDSYWVNFTRICNSNNENSSSSVIDHFFYSSGLRHLIQDAGVIHSPENRSDHSPIYCVLSSLTVKLDLSASVRPAPKPSWRGATMEEKVMYRDLLEDRLIKISVPQCVIECKDVKCRW